MAPELNDVNVGETIASQYGNALRDRTVQRYADAAARDTEHPSPLPGDLSYLANTGDVARYHSGWENIVPTGVGLPFFGSTAPTGFLLAQGQAVSRTNFAALFAEIGTTYGSGDGSTTFNLPDMRQRFPLGKAASGTGSTLGGTGGAIDHAHSNPNVNSNGSHTHSQGNTGSGGSHNHGGFTGTLNDSGTGVLVYSGSNNHNHSISTEAAHAHSNPNTNSAGAHTHSQGNTGTGNPPYLVVNFIIKT